MEIKVYVAAAVLGCKDVEKGVCECLVKSAYLTNDNKINCVLDFRDANYDVDIKAIYSYWDLRENVDDSTFISFHGVVGHSLNLKRKCYYSVNGERRTEDLLLVTCNFVDYGMSVLQRPNGERFEAGGAEWYSDEEEMAKCVPLAVHHNDGTTTTEGGEFAKYRLTEGQKAAVELLKKAVEMCGDQKIMLVYDTDYECLQAVNNTAGDLTTMWEYLDKDIVPLAVITSVCEMDYVASDGRIVREDK